MKNSVEIFAFPIDAKRVGIECHKEIRMTREYFDKEV